METVEDTLKDVALVLDMLKDCGDRYDIGCSDDQFYSIIKRARRYNPTHRNLY